LLILFLCLSYDWTEWKTRRFNDYNGCKHPDIEQFVAMKHDLTKVTGANVSVKISDDFMRAVENKETFTLQFPVESDKPKITKEIEATDLWNLIVESATKTAEPGLMMWDNIINNLPAESYADVGFKTITTNPCGEIPLSAYDSCRLISINLKNLVKNPFKKPKFDFDKLYEITCKAMRMSDDLVELEIEKLENIIKACDTKDEKQLWKSLLKACKDGRRTGLGTHGLADAIACLNLRYDSDEAAKVIEKIYETVRNAAYTESVNLAKQRGAFQCLIGKKKNRIPISRDCQKFCGKKFPDLEDVTFLFLQMLQQAQCLLCHRQAQVLSQCLEILIKATKAFTQRKRREARFR
jgi:ribonucleoside-diphosphate reductase alpha chain